MVLAVVVAVLAFQIFSVARTEEDLSQGMPSPPRPQVDPELLENPPPGLPPDLPPSKPPVNAERLAQNDPFDWSRQAGPAAGEDANLSTLRLLRIRGEGDEAIVQIETDASRKWYTVGEAFESYELLSVDAEAGTAEVFDESLNRTRTIRLE